MASMNRYVSTNADIKAYRSRFYEPRRSKHSYFHGFLQPLGSPVEVLPGDTIKAKLSAFVRMSTPIVPFIDQVRFEGDFFFVPKRVLFDGTKQFYGEAPTFGIATKISEPTISVRSPYSPLVAMSTASAWSNIQKSECLATAFGLVYQASAQGNVEANVLPVRAYFAVYNEYYRNQNYQNQYTWDKSQNGLLASSPVAYFGGTPISANSYLPRVNKDSDLFTSILPWAQKGTPVSIALTDLAPVVAQSAATSSGLHSMGASPQFGYSTGGTVLFGSGDLGLGTGGTLNFNGASGGTGTNLTYSNLYADLSSATAVKINDLLYALAYEDFLARCARFGTRFKEYIYAMFGTTLPDLTADVPEYLGRLKFDINVQQVVQTTGFNASASTELGALGAYSNSGKYGEIFTKSFTEPGYLVGVFYTKHQRTYSTGVDPVFTKKDLLDYYQTPFADIPDMPISCKPIWLDDSGSDLGFQEPWWDYHIQIDRTYGMMNPTLDTLGQIWTLAEQPSAKPSITYDFFYEDRNAIARVLATGVDGPDYLVDCLLELDMTRVMPVTNSGTLKRF